MTTFSFYTKQTVALARKIIVFAIAILNFTNDGWGQANSKAISGTVVDIATGEEIIGAQISGSQSTQTAQTNNYGFFSINVTLAEPYLFVNIPGYEEEMIRLSEISEQALGKIGLLKTTATTLKEVVVNAERSKLRAHVHSTQMGKVDLPIDLLKKVPALGGEPDIIKALQLTPGVKRGGEGTIGMYVRGGNLDENLILLDEATIYNVGHLLGFFSVFNTAALKDVQLYKSSFPAKYGGRLSSIMDVSMKNGNGKHFQAEGSIGLISSNLTIEGPIAKDRASFLVSGRRTYLDFVSNNRIPYHFYDINAKLNYKIDERNKIYWSGYKGDDVLKLSEQSENFNTGMFLGNEASTLRWNHQFKNPKLFVNTSLIYTKFRYDIFAKMQTENLNLKSAINDLGLKLDFQFNTNNAHQMSFGGTVTQHAFRPNIMRYNGSLALDELNKEGSKLTTYEQAVYINDDWQINKRWQLNVGLRLSALYTQKEWYINPEPRIATRFLLNEQHSIKLSYARMAQYLHLVSSSAVTLPTDLWYPVTAKTKPGQSDQVSIGYYYAQPEKGLVASIEGYYKKLYNQIEYREGANLLFNDKYEEELIKGKGKAYGAELFVSKTAGKLSGWIGYSLSLAERQFEELNLGKPFSARFDRRHDFSLVSAYDISRRHIIAATWVYSSGSPFTPQIGQYIAPNPSNTQIDILPIYGAKNSARLSASNRIDIDYGYKFKWFGKVSSEFHISIYNLLNRAQPGRVSREYNGQTGKYEYKEKGLFGRIPTLSLNFKL